MSESFGAFLRQIRLERGLSQSQIPYCSHSQISALERGTRHPSAEMLVTLAKGLAIPIETLYLYLEGTHDSSELLKTLQILKENKQWHSLYKTSREILRSQVYHLSPHVYHQVEALVKEASSHLEEAAAIAEQLGPYTTPKELFNRVMSLAIAGLPLHTTIKYFNYLRTIIHYDAPIYGKVLNNGMVALEESGQLPQAIAWARQGVRWSTDQLDGRRQIQMTAALFRYLTYFGECSEWYDLKNVCTQAVSFRNDSYVWEDFYYALAWHYWATGQKDKGQQILRDAFKNYSASWGEVAPWRLLFMAGWEAEQGCFEPLTQWVEQWLGSGWNRWGNEKTLWYMQTAVLIALRTKHPSAILWTNWLMSALRLQHMEGWLQLWSAFTPYCDNNSFIMLEPFAVPAWARVVAQHIWTKEISCANVHVIDLA